MLERLLGNGVRTTIVESPDRFARDLIHQLLGHDLLKDRGITLIAASSPQHFLEDTPTAVPVRQMLGGVADFEKTTLVAKLKAARERKKKATGKCGGRKTHVETRPAAVALARSLARKKSRSSLRAKSAELEAQGFVNERGKPFNPKSIRSMLGRNTS
jgi:DNA invertase Pin-like site-specific DNA recombinase